MTTNQMSSFAATERFRVGGYRRFAPPRSLTHVVAGLWVRATPEDTPTDYHRLLPDPCTALAGLLLQRAADGTPQHAELYLHGPTVTPRRFGGGRNCGSADEDPQSGRQNSVGLTADLPDRSGLTVAP